MVNETQSGLESVLLQDLQDSPTTEAVKPKITSEKIVEEKGTKLSLETLKDIFKDEVLEKLSLNDLTLSLAEVLKKVKATEVEFPYALTEVEGHNYLSLTYQLPVAEVLSAGTKLQPKSSDVTMSVKSLEDNQWEFSYRVELTSNGELEEKKKLLSQYYVLEAKQVFDDSLVDLATIEYKFEDELPVSAFRDNKKYLIKVPIAKKGTYHHPVYKVLDFSEEILQTIENNIKSNVVGYPIPITFGHLGDGAVKQGELVRVYREGDILFGEWEVNKETYRKVEDGEITFSSSEFFPDYINKTNGEPVGRTLFGMALTNRPYMPNQPRVMTLSDKTETESYHFTSKLNFTELHYNNREVLSNNENSELDKQIDQEEIKMSEEQKKEVLEVDNSTIQLSEQVQLLQQQLSEYHTKLAEVEENYKQKLSEYHTVNEQLASKVQKYEDRIKEEEINAKLAYLTELKLPADITEKYSELIKNGTLGESEEVVLTSLAKLSQINNTELLTQHGYSNSTAKMNDEMFEDPYAKVIEYNKKLSEAKKMQTIASLA